jgi:PAS domain S-box-containing protein
MDDMTRFDLYRAFVEQIPDAVIFADREGIVRIWNDGAQAVFGYTAADMLGKGLDVIIPEDLRQRHNQGFDRAMANGHTRLGNRVMTTRSIQNNESRLYVDLSFAVIKDESGLAIGALAVGRNATERYLSDRALRKRVAEMEERLKGLSEQPLP